MSNQEEQQQNSEDSDSSDEGVSVPEDFQKQVHTLVKSAPKAHLNHMRDKINEREDSIRKEAMNKGGKNGAKSMDYSIDSMPS